MNITIRQVDAFLMVAELRSFTAAGAALHITQSAVSNLVKDLEDQIGVQLFDRGRRVVKRMSGIHLAIPVFSKGYRPKQGKVAP